MSLVTKDDVYDMVDELEASKVDTDDETELVGNGEMYDESLVYVCTLNAEEFEVVDESIADDS